MFRLKRLSRGLSLLLSLVLVLAPVVPAFAFVAESGDARAAHAFHDGKADISDHASHEQTSCAQHDSCAGQDRDCCAHCFGLVSLVQAAYLHSHPVQTPVLSQLHSLVLVTSPDRPPRFLFL
jgi:cobyrinic acid a,c-diamide synthase